MSQGVLGIMLQGRGHEISDAMPTFGDRSIGAIAVA
jgi:hypothetical protein